MNTNIQLKSLLESFSERIMLLLLTVNFQIEILTPCSISVQHTPPVCRIIDWSVIDLQMIFLSERWAAVCSTATRRTVTWWTWEHCTWGSLFQRCDLTKVWLPEELYSVIKISSFTHCTRYNEMLVQKRVTCRTSHNKGYA